MSRRGERRARRGRAEQGVEQRVGCIRVDARRALDAELPVVGQHEPAVEGELLVVPVATAGLVPESRQNHVEAVAVRRLADAARRVDGQPHGLTHLHVVEEHLGEPDRVLRRSVSRGRVEVAGRQVGRERFDLDFADGAAPGTRPPGLRVCGIPVRGRQ